MPYCYSGYSDAFIVIRMFLFEFEQETNLVRSESKQKQTKELIEVLREGKKSICLLTFAAAKTFRYP